MLPRNNPFASFADPNSFLGRPFIPAVGEALAGAARSTINALTPRGQTPPSTMAGVSIPPTGATAPNLNPFPFLASLNPLAGSPLVQASRMQRGEVQQPVARAATLPSGAMMTGASSDIYPTTQRFAAPTVPLPSTQSPASLGANMLTPTFPSSGFSARPEITPSVPMAPTQNRIQTAVREGTISATPQQLENLNARTTAFEGRTPAQQQALLAQMRIRGAETMRKNLAEQESIIAQRRANPELYATPAGGMISSPTNMFGRPIPEFQQRYAQRERGIQNQAATNTSMLASTGFGRMQQDFQRQTEFGMGRSPLYRGMGISASVAGGPQPSSPMLANNTMNQRSRMFPTI